MKYTAEDAISRLEVYERHGSIPVGVFFDIRNIILSIDNRPHGHWINLYHNEWRYECSACHHGAFLSGPYCWQCGAVMDEQEVGAPE